MSQPGGQVGVRGQQAFLADTACRNPEVLTCTPGSCEQFLGLQGRVCKERGQGKLGSRAGSRTELSSVRILLKTKRTQRGWNVTVTTGHAAVTSCHSLGWVQIGPRLPIVSGACLPLCLRGAVRAHALLAFTVVAHRAQSWHVVRTGLFLLLFPIGLCLPGKLTYSRSLFHVSLKQLSCFQVSSV